MIFFKINFSLYFIHRNRLNFNTNFLAIYTKQCPNYVIKLFKICLINDYTWTLKIYIVKSARGQRQVGLAENVCLRLYEKLLYQGETMLEKLTHVVGTLRAYKKKYPKRCPSNLKMNRLLRPRNLTVLKTDQMPQLFITASVHKSTRARWNMKIPRIPQTLPISNDIQKTVLVKKSKLI